MQPVQIKYLDQQDRELVGAHIDHAAHALLGRGLPPVLVAEEGGEALTATFARQGGTEWLVMLHLPLLMTAAQARAAAELTAAASRLAGTADAGRADAS